MRRTPKMLLSWLGLLVLLAGSLAGAPPSRRAAASDTPAPTAVTLVGSLQSELGCPGDWQPDCAATRLTSEAVDGVWQATFDLPAGTYEYKVALNNSWDENYGANATRNGSNIALNLTGPTTVKFYYDHETHWMTSNQNSSIATVPGSFQSELGCAGDWDPGCLRSWLQDPEGDGIYTFTTAALPPGSYEAKVAVNESWSENYGTDGIPNGPNIPFAVSAAGAAVTFSYTAATHILTVTEESTGPRPDNNVEYYGLGHNSQESLYRTPFGALTPGTPLTLRFRTFHGDVTGVRVRFWDSVAGRQFFQEMQPAAEDVSCYDPAQSGRTCDFWQTTYTPAQPNTLYYRFIVTDGTATAYYADDRFMDGGWGQATPNLIDNSYAVTVYHPSFQPVSWMKDAVVYQIFPDRFRNGRANNDPVTTEPRYGYPGFEMDQINAKDWTDLPEGYCRGYAGSVQPCTEGPRGRDYFGGDLRGVTERLNYLKDLGINVIYFNPIFESGSNHGYDTQDYYQIDHLFGTLKEFDDLVKQGQKAGIRVILDGVFNHVSSDSMYFDRYGHFDTVGACESPASPYRSWFTFTDVAEGTGTCVDSMGRPNSATYASWWGFDSIPEVNKQIQAVKDLVYAGSNPVASYWLKQGAAGWRLDVPGDPSFPADFWPGFRQTVKAARPDAPIIGELWKKADVLPMIRGDQMDTTMNYRLRNAILGFFGTVDDKGFADDGASNQPPSLFAAKLMSIREDYPDATYYTLINLLDSHDTERILWSLTPGGQSREEKEWNAANLAAGTQLLKLATVVQMTIPGAPTIYYGDEVGLTGDDDPDDRRTFPWVESADARHGAGGDQDLRAHYQKVISLRAENPVLRNGNLSFLLTNDTDRTLAYLMRTPNEAAVVAINRSSETKTLAISLGGKLPDGVQLKDAFGTLGTVSAASGTLTVTLPGLSAAVLLPVPGQDLTPPPAPAGLTAAGSSRQVTLTWSAVSGAAGYRIYRSPVSGGGYVAVGEAAGTSYTDTGLTNGQEYFYVVTALDQAGNEGTYSGQQGAVPVLTIGWANLQWPPAMEHTISATNRTEFVYGQVWIDGATNLSGSTPGLTAQLGFGPDGSMPAGNPAWVWVNAQFNVDAGNNDEFKANLLPETTGTFDYAYRYSTDGGRTWLYADLDGIGNGYSPANAGSLTVRPIEDTTAPDVPTGLHVIAGTPAGIQLGWNPVSDPTLHGYEVRRSTTSGGPYTTIALVTGATGYTDTAVAEGAGYYYTVRAVDTALNRSADSAEVYGTAALRTVTLIFTVTVPDNTDATGRQVNLAGTLDRLNGGLPSWNPGGLQLTRVDATHWTVTLTGAEATTVEYKYALGDWDHVEKDTACGEVGNRLLTLTYGAGGVQSVSDTVANWRNVSPCGN